MRDYPDISEKTKREIKLVAKKLGYTPNLIARKLSSKKTNSIGVIVPHIAHSFFSASIEGIYKEAYRKGYDIILMVSMEDHILEARHIQTLLSLQVDGFLISTTKRTKDITPFKTILQKGKKLVFFDRIIENLGSGCVVCDNREGIYKLVSFAIKNGYTKIGYIGGYKDIYIGIERWKGFERALKEHNIPIQPQWITVGGFDQQDGHDGFMKIYQSGTLPELIVTGHYSIALGALGAIEELGLRIPQDIEIIAFGESLVNQFLKPALTTSKLDARKLGQCALDLLINFINSEEQKYKKVVIPAQLMINDTGLKPLVNIEKEGY